MLSNLFGATQLVNDRLNPDVSDPKVSAFQQDYHVPGLLGMISTFPLTDNY